MSNYDNSKGELALRGTFFIWCTRALGPLVEHEVPLESRKVYCMSRARQEKIFENVPGHTRVKKVVCQLAHLFGFEPELKHAKTVIVSLRNK